MGLAGGLATNGGAAAGKTIQSGSANFTGDGTTLQFNINFPVAFASVPSAVFAQLDTGSSTSVAIKSVQVAAVGSFTVTMASSVANGTTITVYWMAVS